MATTLARIEFRRKTAAQWTSSNEVLLASEPGVETDTGKFKLGDGTTGWSSLPYQAGTAASLAATYEALGKIEVRAETFAGYDATGATASTTAIQNAINAAQTSGVNVVRLTGTPKSGPLTITTNGFKLVGDSYRTTNVKFIGTGDFITIGTDNGAAVDANDYSGVNGFMLEDIRLSTINPATATDNGFSNYTPGTVAIRDWRGGDVRLRNVAIYYFDTPFAGISSDLDVWENVQINGAHSFTRFYSRSDQLHAINVEWYYCDATWDLDGVGDVVIDRALFYACGVPFTASTFTDLATTNGSATITSATAGFTSADRFKVITGPGIPDSTIILSVQSSTQVTLDNNATATATGGTFSVYRTGARNGLRIRSSTRQASSITFNQPMFETGAPANYEAFVDIGIGDTVTSVGVHFKEPIIRTSTPLTGAHVGFLAKIDNADGVTIEDPNYWNNGSNSANWLDGLFYLTGATANTVHRARYRVPTGSAGRRSLRILSDSTGSPAPQVLREVYGNSLSTTRSGAFHGFMASDTLMVRLAVDQSNGALNLESFDLTSSSVGSSLAIGAGAGSSSGAVSWKLVGALNIKDASFNNVLTIDSPATQYGRLSVASIVRPRNAQTLAANGAVTFDAFKGDATVTLNANATSSTITNPTADQHFSITWIQDATGGRTYSWPTNCKFAGGSGGIPSDTTVSRRTTVTFRYNSSDSSWYEISRAVAIG